MTGGGLCDRQWALLAGTGRAAG